MSNLYREPSIDASYQVVHLAMWFQRRRFFEIDQSDWDEMSNLYREPSIDASYQVVHRGVSEEKIKM